MGMDQQIIGRIKMNKIQKMLSVYFVAGTQDCLHLPGSPAQNLLVILTKALQAGITCFQFRDKGQGSLEAMPDQQKQLAMQCLHLCHQYQVPMIVNDNVDLALEIQADGIHVGQSDMAVSEILAKRKGKMLLGLSTNNWAELLAAKDNDNIDYLGVGPIFATASKRDHSEPLGLDYVAHLTKLDIQKPYVVIGGINEHNAAQLRQAGAKGVAVISAITQSKDMAKTIRQLRGECD